MELTVGSFVELVVVDTGEIENDRNEMKLMKKVKVILLN